MMLAAASGMLSRTVGEVNRRVDRPMRGIHAGTWHDSILPTDSIDVPWV
jgi:hypothetical protein